MPPLIIARDLYKCYPGFPPVLRGVNINVEAGELVAIMGPSGCGKSTMLHILGLLHSPDGGELSILGKDVLKLDREQTAAFRRGNLGFVMQASNLFEHSTVFENVEFPLIYENVPPQERWSRVIHALDLVRLSSRVHYRSNRLSGGEQQRVAIARAMVNNPRILLADEPTGALDARTSNLIMDNFRNLCHSGGVAMVMVTHDPKMADFCDSVYTLEEGVLRQQKKGVSPFTTNDGKDVLRLPEPLSRTALVTPKFPPDRAGNLLAERLYRLRLISTIYSLASGGFLGNPQGYALPLPARQLGLWGKMGALIGLLRRARGSQSIWPLWKQLSATGRKGLIRRLVTFACGARLARWGMKDRVQFFYGAKAGRAATAAWIAARILRTPFAFAVSHADTKDGEWIIKGRDAVFVTCSSSMLKRKMAEAAPDLAAKIIIMPDLLPVMPAEDETVTPAPPSKPPHILLYVQNIAHAGELLAACHKAGNATALTILGGKNKAIMNTAAKAGFKGHIDYVEMDREESLGEALRDGDIFLMDAYDPGADVPTPLAEAMAFGLAIVVSTACSPDEGILADGINALICPQEDGEKLGADVAALAHDPVRRAELGGNAKKDIFNYLDSRTAEKIMADRLVAAVGREDEQKSILLPEI